MIINKVNQNEDLQGEEWLSVVDYEGLYEVSNYGRVKCLSNSATRKEKILKPQIQRDGYNRVTLSKKGQKKRVPIHRLVAIAFIPNPLQKEQVNHLDADKLNNKLTNLQWATRKENIAHAIALGLMKKNNKAVIATHLDTGEQHQFESQSEASRKHCVSMNNIYNVLQGKTSHINRWKFEHSQVS
jgi:hypothetical protein